MTMRRTLSLKHETLSELTPDDLATVVGAAVITLDEDCKATTLCITRRGLTCDSCTPERVRQY